MMVLAASAGLAAAQSGSTTSSTDGSTPLALAPGSPMGSYALSGFDTVNPFNGALNFRLPLHGVSGRGQTQAALTLPIEFKWRVQHVTIPNMQGGDPTHYYFPTYD